jgi:hypothetical protein
MEQWLNWFMSLSRRTQVGALLGSGAWFLIASMVILGTHPKINIWKLPWLYTSADGPMSSGFSWIGIALIMSTYLAFIALLVLVRIVPSPGEEAPERENR